jgi:chromate transporter
MERLLEVLAVFGRLGATAFGGPAAHVALQEEECVRRRGWLDRRRFLDLLAATNLIPGPNSTEMAIHLGYLRAGWPGLVAGGVAFILPSAVAAAALAAIYVRFGALPVAAAVVEALRPAVLVVIADALVRFAATATRGATTALVALAAAGLALAGVSEVALVFLAAALGAAAVARPPRARLHGVGLVPLALVFAKIGATLFGSGYVLVAYLRTELGTRGWVTDGQILDAIAIGQVTPGPVSSAATFLGFLLAGPAGAAVATAGMFLPSFVLVAATGPFLERWQRVRMVRGALDAVNAAVVGLIAAVVVRLVPSAAGGAFQIAIAVGAACGLWALRLPGATILAAAAAIGVARALV